MRRNTVNSQPIDVIFLSSIGSWTRHILFYANILWFWNVHVLRMETLFLVFIVAYIQVIICVFSRIRRCGVRKKLAWNVYLFIGIVSDSESETIPFWRFGCRYSKFRLDFICAWRWRFIALSERWWRLKPWSYAKTTTSFWDGASHVGTNTLVNNFVNSWHSFFFSKTVNSVRNIWASIYGSHGPMTNLIARFHIKLKTIMAKNF